jgi:hypothetical protein
MLLPQVFRFAAFLLLAFPALAAEPDALAIEANILARHLPYGTVLNPILSADGSSVTDYTRCGDSAIWTGHYLAAEAFRYAATHSPAALNNVRNALEGIAMLMEITGNDLLARCALPASSPYAASISSQEAANGIYQVTRGGEPWIWVGNTSRDQYSGVFFGLGAAWDMAPAREIRSSVRTIATRLLNRLIATGWNVVMPDLSVSTTFLIQPDQQLTLLQIGRHVNSAQFSTAYSQMAGSLAVTVPIPMGIDSADDHSSYFKFNLDFINLYNLIRLEDNASYRTSYERGFSEVRNTTDNHLNPHFNLIDRALHGPDATRDAETVADLNAWLQRPRTDVYVNWNGQIAACSTNEACHPLPIVQRPPDDFLWQLDPFQLSGGGQGTIETAGIDYILPYWMARYFGVVSN